MTGRWPQSSTAGPFPGPRSAAAAGGSSSPAASRGGCHPPLLAAPPCLRLSFTPRRTFPSLPQDPPAAAAAAGRPEGQPGRPAAERGCPREPALHGSTGPRWEVGAGVASQHPAAPRPGPPLCPVSLGEEPCFPLSASEAPGRAERREGHTGTRERRPWQRPREKGGKGKEPLKAQ